MTEPLYKQYEHAHPIGIYPMCNFGGLVILDIIEHADTVIAAFDFGTGYQKIRRHKIYYSDTGRAYIRKNSTRYYFDNVMKVGCQHVYGSRYNILVCAASTGIYAYERLYEVKPAYAGFFITHIGKYWKISYNDYRRKNAMYKNVVAVGNEKYKIHDCYTRLRSFDTLTAAKQYARKHENISVFRLYFANDTGDLLYTREFPL